MKRNHHRLLTTSALALLIASTSSFADDPSAACNAYLNNYSDSAFLALVASNRSTANTIAQALSACQIANSCSVLSSADNCASLLATRAFESNYYANFSENPTPGNVPAPIVSLPKSDTNIKSTATQNTVSETDNQTKTNNTTGSSIHWF